MDECKPLLHGRFGMEVHSMHPYRPVGPAMTLTAAMEGVAIDLDGRRLHSSTFRLDVSTFRGMRWVHAFPPVY